MPPIDSRRAAVSGTVVIPAATIHFTSDGGFGPPAIQLDVATGAPWRDT